MTASTIVPLEYRMRTENSCGPDALTFAARLSPSQVDEAWKIDDIEKFSNAKDSPWHHEVVLNRLGKTMRTIDCASILRGDFARNRTVVLYHYSDSPILKQHWIVVSQVVDHHVIIHGGDGITRMMKEEDFVQGYANGIPACAYEILDCEGPEPAWYKRLWFWITDLFFGG